MNDSSRFLRNALKANTAFSLSSGISLILLNSRFSAWMDIPPGPILPIIGSGLVLFALFVLYNAIRQQISPSLVKSIILQDLIWVAGALFLGMLNTFGLSLTGQILLISSAIPVGLLAFLQARGLRRLNSGSAPTASGNQ